MRWVRDCAGPVGRCLVAAMVIDMAIDDARAVIATLAEPDTLLVFGVLAVSTSRRGGWGRWSGGGGRHRSGGLSGWWTPGRRVGRGRRRGVARARRAASCGGRGAGRAGDGGVTAWRQAVAGG